MELNKRYVVAMNRAQYELETFATNDKELANKVFSTWYKFVNSWAKDQQDRGTYPPDFYLHLWRQDRGTSFNIEYGMIVDRTGTTRMLPTWIKSSAYPERVWDLALYLEVD